MIDTIAKEISTELTKIVFTDTDDEDLFEVMIFDEKGLTKLHNQICTIMQNKMMEKHNIEAEKPKTMIREWIENTVIPFFFMN